MPHKLYKKVFKKFGDKQGFSLAAGISFHTLLAAVPIIGISIGLIGNIISEQLVIIQTRNAINNFAGDYAANFMYNVLIQISSENSIVGSIIGISLAILTIALLFTHLQHTMNDIWNVKKAQTKLFKNFIKRRFFALLSVIVLILTISLGILTTILISYWHQLSQDILGATFNLPIFYAMNYLITFVLLTLLLAILFTILPDQKIHFRSVIPGAALTSILLLFGQLVLGVMFTISPVKSLYGAFGSFMVLLTWVYYSANIFLLGAMYASIKSKQK